MKTATVRDLRNHYRSLLRWVAAGKEVLITRRGREVARLLPAAPVASQNVDWAGSLEVKRDRRRESKLTAAQSTALLAEAGGKW